MKSSCLSMKTPAFSNWSDILRSAVRRREPKAFLMAETAPNWPQLTCSGLFLFTMRKTRKSIAARKTRRM